MVRRWTSVKSTSTASAWPASTITSRPGTRSTARPCCSAATPLHPLQQRPYPEHSQPAGQPQGQLLRERQAHLRPARLVSRRPASAGQLVAAVAGVDSGALRRATRHADDPGQPEPSDHGGGARHLRAYSLKRYATKTPAPTKPARHARIPHPALRATFSRREKDMRDVATRLLLKGWPAARRPVIVSPSRLIEQEAKDENPRAHSANRPAAVQRAG